MDLGYLFIMFYLENYTDLIFVMFISHEFRVSHQRLKVYIETHVGRSDQLYPRPFQVEGSVIIRRGRNLKKCRKKRKTFFVVSTCFSKTSSFDDI